MSGSRDGRSRHDPWCSARVLSSAEAHAPREREYGPQQNTKPVPNSIASMGRMRGPRKPSIAQNLLIRPSATFSLREKGSCFHSFSPREKEHEPQPSFNTRAEQYWL